MSGDRITFGAAALPEPDRAWLAAAEDLPIESVWQGGHVLPPTNTGEAITRLALMTAWTERVRVGSAILLLPLYQPVLVAKQLADLDSRSGGRLTVGVGVGGEFPSEFDAIGVPIAERGARTDEAIDVLRALWAGGLGVPPRRRVRLRRRRAAPGHPARRRRDRRCSSAGHRSSCRAASRRPCAGPPVGATAGCRT